jgi:cysteine desulfuration protein SufE
MAGLPTLSDLLEEYQLVEAEDRYRLLIDLGRQLVPMPDALKTEATKVPGCSASVWVYPTAADGQLHFLADSNAAITKGVVALVLSAVQDRPASEVAKLDILECLAPFELSRHLSANRTQGVPNMIALVKRTAERYSKAA